MSNLLDNALHHNHSGGNVQVLVDTQAGQVSLKVTDAGPVVPPEQLNRLLQPFRRLVADRGGHHDEARARLVDRPGDHHRPSRTPRPSPWQRRRPLDIEVRFPAAIAASSGHRPP